MDTKALEMCSEQWAKQKEDVIKETLNHYETPEDTFKRGFSSGFDYGTTRGFQTGFEYAVKTLIPLIKNNL
jgi:hypothetical protein